MQSHSLSHQLDDHQLLKCEFLLQSKGLMFIPPGALCSFLPVRPPSLPTIPGGRHPPARARRSRATHNQTRPVPPEGGGRQRDPQPQPGMGLAPTLPQPATCPHRSPPRAPLVSASQARRRRTPRSPRPAQAEGKALVLRDPQGPRARAWRGAGGVAASGRT